MSVAEAAEPGWRYPIFGIFAGCCASAMTATASSTTTNRIDKTLLSSLHTPFVMYHAGGSREKMRFMTEGDWYSLSGKTRFLVRD